MKTLLLTTLAILLSTVIFAQTPQAFKYQAVIRNNQGKVLVSQIVSLRVSILQNDPLGSPVYIETHQIATNEYGIANLSIGSGTVVTGIFADIAWGTTTHFVKTELDITGNQNYEFIGTSQLLSVPYALYAEKAGNANDDMDKDPANEIQTISKTDSTVTLSKNGGSFIDNDKQILSLNANQLTISKGNTVTFTGAVDLDADPTNELQVLNYSNDTLYLSNGNYVILPKNNDNDSTNEFQTLQKFNDTISITNGNSIILNDDDILNEIQTLTYIDNTLTLSKEGGSVTIEQNHNSESVYLRNTFDGIQNDDTVIVNQSQLTAKKLVIITVLPQQLQGGGEIWMILCDGNNNLISVDVYEDGQYLDVSNGEFFFYQTGNTWQFYFIPQVDITLFVKFYIKNGSGSSNFNGKATIIQY